MEHEIDDDVMIAQILFSSQPSIYITTIEILTREQSIRRADFYRTSRYYWP
jgi:hypothetical protein